MRAAAATAAPVVNVCRKNIDEADGAANFPSSPASPRCIVCAPSQPRPRPRARPKARAPTAETA
eukprot:139922-Chlamydomonas_euryale.AAC.1